MCQIHRINKNKQNWIMRYKQTNKKKKECKQQPVFMVLHIRNNPPLHAFCGWWVLSVPAVRLWAKATWVTAARSWAKETGMLGSASKWGAEVFRALLHFFLQIFLEADRQDREPSQNEKSSQRVPGDGLSSCGQFVQLCTCVDGYKGWWCYSCKGNKNMWDRVFSVTKIKCKGKKGRSYREKYQWRKPPKAS